MIAIAQILIWLGAVLGVAGIIGCICLVAWWHDRRSAHEPLTTPRRSKPRAKARFDQHSVIHHHGRHA